jgi:arginase
MAIRSALHSPSANLWTEDGIDLGEVGCFTDGGDIDLEGAPDARAVNERISSAVKRVLDGGAKPLLLGGDHSVTYPIVRAIAAVHRPLSLLHIDAHPDLYPEIEGDRYSHACPFARIMEDGLVDQLVQVGIRTLSGAQHPQVERYGVEMIDMRAWGAGRRPVLRHPVYISIDIDALDPAFAPGVSHREPGGLSVREVLTLVQSIDLPIVGADVVELNPRQDVGDLTARVAAKLVKELLARLMRR